MNFDLLRKHVADGVVNAQQHPTLPLTIYNYAARCQYERLWDDVTLQCRGLVCHGEQIVARPFRKFFNDTEHTELPWHLPSVVTEKMDGSLGIMFHFDGEWHWSTRGSFTSEQAREAALIWQERHADIEPGEDYTHLFEIIYPENRIVVDYGQRRDLVLLGMIETQTGYEAPLILAHPKLTVVRQLGFGSETTLRDLRSIIRDDEEGYVVRFDNGLRVKVKGARYVELHKAISGLSSRSIWECMSSERDVSELLAVVPDECADWIRSEAWVMKLNFVEKLHRTIGAVEAVEAFATRKEQALFIRDKFSDIASAVFALLDNKDPKPILWKSIYPERRVPRMTARLEA